jgi:hypothetical protein
MLRVTVKKSANRLIAVSAKASRGLFMIFILYQGGGRLLHAQWSRLSADEERDFSDWVEASKDKETRKTRIEKACTLLAAGKRRS